MAATPGRGAGTGAVRASLEQPMWRALTAYRVLALCYALALFARTYEDHGRPLAGTGYLAVLLAWTLFTLRSVSSAGRCGPRFLAGDMTVAVTGILLSPVADPGDRVGPTLPSIWVAGAVLAFALKGGWRWAAGASALVGAANLVEDARFSGDTLHNVLLVCVASIALGYVAEVARASERTLARALGIEAATRERERLARGIHDSVLQVLAMVQRRGAAVGGEAAELGRLAGEQETALRELISGSGTDGGTAGGEDGKNAGEEPPGASAGLRDLRALLAPAARSGATFAGPGDPVLLPVREAEELAAAVGAALDNVRQHASGPSGRPAVAWILLEDEPGAVLVTVRDDGPGIPPGRLAEAEAEGRLGAAQSIRGRLRDLGGSAEWVSRPGEGTEVELRLPRRSAGKGARAGGSGRRRRNRR